jgi:hypothetical protein
LWLSPIPHVVINAEEGKTTCNYLSNYLREKDCMQNVSPLSRLAWTADVYPPLVQIV